jgi:hypothetical protein
MPLLIRDGVRLENVLTPHGVSDHPYIGTRAISKDGAGTVITAVRSSPGYLITLSRLPINDKVNPCCDLPCPIPTDTVTVTIGEGQPLISDDGTPWFPRMGVGKTLYDHRLSFPFRYENKIDVPPYWVGAILSRGCSMNDDVTIPVPSLRHYEVMALYNTRFYHIDSVRRGPLYDGTTGSNNLMAGTYGFQSFLNYQGRPDLSLDLEALDVLGTPWSKAHIPSNYQHATYDERLAFLRGVMDYRGTVNKGVAQLMITSRPMLEDLHYLVRRLGGNTSIKTCGCCDDPCGWLVDIYLPNGESPFHVTPIGYKSPIQVKAPPWVVIGIELTDGPILVGSVPAGNYYIYPDVLVGSG